MEVRMIEMSLPVDRLEPLRERVRALEPIEVDAFADQDGQRAILRIMVRKAEVEHFVNQFESLAERFDDFRMTLFAVEATLPRPIEPQQEAETGSAEEKREREEADRLSRVELHAQVAGNARLNSEYLLMVLFSSIVASVGLVQGNVAVIVGAMVIAPLLGPNMALALAATLADTELGIRAVKTGMSGVVLAVTLGLASGWLFQVDPGLEEIASRTRINHLDLILALAAGGAGAMATTSGVAGALVGVMVAVALLPPLLVAALLAGAGHWQGAAGAALLYSTNIAAVNLAAMSVFLSRGLTPHRWWEKTLARRSATVFMVFWIIALIALAAAFVYYNFQLRAGG